MYVTNSQHAPFCFLAFFSLTHFCHDKSPFSLHFYEQKRQKVLKKLLFSEKYFHLCNEINTSLSFLYLRVSFGNKMIIGRISVSMTAIIKPIYLSDERRPGKEYGHSQNRFFPENQKGAG